MLSGVSCLEEALECGGKKSEFWFWNRVTLVAGRKGDWTSLPPAPLALMSLELGGTRGDSGSSGSGQEHRDSPLWGTVCWGGRVRAGEPQASLPSWASGGAGIG